jgi:hypothetical protein
MIDEHFKEVYSSFLVSESVGIGTLACLHMLARSDDEFDRHKWNYILRQKVFEALPRCNTEQILSHGSAGYLFALLLLETKIKDKIE